MEPKEHRRFRIGCLFRIIGTDDIQSVKIAAFREQQGNDGRRRPLERIAFIG